MLMVRQSRHALPEITCPDVQLHPNMMHLSHGQWQCQTCAHLAVLTAGTCLGMRRMS